VSSSTSPTTSRSRHRMSTEYRPWREDDDLRLLEVWPDAPSAPAQAFRARLGADDDAAFSRTLVAVDDGVPVAAGVVYDLRGMDKPSVHAPIWLEWN
ncbi:hypothetical protein RA276_28375, partial [Pseudomonas syringae pv. tagetis]|uniref:hypothetical protein n=1 Tax=Pseudomonas syringae group genomosp. 7 TaxID=251699 RepID=UPI0037706950